MSVIRQIARSIKRKAIGQPAPEAIGQPVPDSSTTSKPFNNSFSDESMREITDKVRPYTMTSDARLGHLLHAVDYLVTNSIEGDFVECGVWRGGSSMAAMYRLEHHGIRDRIFHLCDTFEGMSPPTSEDTTFQGDSAANLLESSDPDASNVWAKCSLENVKHNVGLTGYPEEHVHFAVGKIEDTMPTSAPNRIALLRLDTDWYESTKHEMETLYPLLVPGGVLIVDDYGHWQGAKKAIDEYVQENEIRLFLVPSDYTGRIAVKP